MLFTILLSVFGLIILTVGAEFLVRGAVQIASALGISPLIIGLTVVAFGTGSPELVVGMIASLKGETTIALGNVIGSNIINVLCVLGLSASVCPLIIHQQLVIWDVPIMIFVSLLVYYSAYLGVISSFMGCIFLILMVAYTILLIYFSKSDRKALKQFEEEFQSKEPFSVKLALKSLLIIGIGILLLQQGANLLVDGAVVVAAYFGLSELVISLTIIALGTSLPELATSVVAAYHGKRDIAVGNIIGSNIFNILAVLGVSAILSPSGIPIPDQALYFDIPVMVIVAVACLPIFVAGHEIARWEGLVFFGYYLIYNTFLVLSTIKHAWLLPFKVVVFVFAIPLTLITLTVSLYRHFKR